MIRHTTLAIAISSILLLTVACRTTQKITTASTPKVPGSVMQEFRAAWVATVANINWPSKPGLSTEEQKKEAIDLLDFLQKHHLREQKAHEP